MSELKQKLEALLFSSGRSMKVEELARLCRASQEDIEKELKELQQEYNEKDSSIMVVNEGDNWKLVTKEKFLDIVKKIITQTELTKSVMETLAVIAFRYPIKQSDLIKIRSNKAYGHLKEIEELGYISRQKHGRTKLIKLTQKFFDYFDLPPEKLKEKFHDFEGIAKAIEEKEKEIERMNKEQRKKSEEEKQKQEEEKKKIEKEIDLIDEEGHKVKLEVVDEKPIEKIEIEKEKLGSLDVVDEPEDDEQQEDDGEENIEISEEESGEKEEDEPFNEDKSKIKEEDGIKTTPEMEEKIEKRVEEIIHPEKEGKESEEETSDEIEGTEEEAEEKTEEEPAEGTDEKDEKPMPNDSEADKAK